MFFELSLICVNFGAVSSTYQNAPVYMINKIINANIVVSWWNIEERKNFNLMLPKLLRHTQNALVPCSDNTRLIRNMLQIKEPHHHKQEQHKFARNQVVMCAIYIHLRIGLNHRVLFLLHENIFTTFQFYFVTNNNS